MTSVGELLTDYLKNFHTSEPTAVKARDLRVLFKLTDKQVRNVVSGLRQKGEPICSSSCGYWYSTDPVDIEKTLRRLEGQVRNMNISITGLKQVLTGGK